MKILLVCCLFLSGCGFKFQVYTGHNPYDYDVGYKQGVHDTQEAIENMLDQLKELGEQEEYFYMPNKGNELESAMIKIIFTILTLGIFWQPSLEYMYKHVTNADDVSWYLSHFLYKKDVTMYDNWKSPKEFIKDGGGDCEDFAIMAYELLTAKGYIVKIYLVYNDDGAHAVCYYKNNKEYGIMSNSVNKHSLSIETYCDEYGYDEWTQYDWKTRRNYIRRK